MLILRCGEVGWNEYTRGSLEANGCGRESDEGETLRWFGREKKK